MNPNSPGVHPLLAPAADAPSIDASMQEIAVAPPPPVVPPRSPTETPPRSPRHQAALVLVAAGCPVIVLRPGGKEPCADDTGRRLEIATVEQVNHLWAQADFNLGVRPFHLGLVAIDVDFHKGVDAAELAALQATPTRTHLTPSGGYHFLFKTPLKFGNHKLARNIDVRSEAGYVVWPPSAINGAEYIIEDHPVAQLPGEIARRLEGKREAAERVTLADTGEDAMPEEADAYCASLVARDHHPGRYALACALVRNFGLSDLTATALCERYGLRMHPSNSRTPWHKVLQHARKYGTGEVGEGPAREDPDSLTTGDPSAFVVPGAKPANGPEGVAQQPAAGGRRKLRIKRCTLLAPERINWLWNGWLAQGKYHAFAGPQGAGKSTLAYSLAATITSGGQWPDGTRAPVGDVFVWSAEDALQDTILPRFIAAGGDPSRLICDTPEEPFDPARDIPALQEALRDVPDLRLIIIDPVVMAVAGDSHKNAETRRGLQPLVNLAEERKAALIGITHFSKGSDKQPTIDRVTGSLAFGALARVVLAAQEMAEGQPRRFVRVKSNIGPNGGGFEYTLDQERLEQWDMLAQKVTWGQPLEGRANELLANPKEETKLDEAKRFITMQLATGPKITDEVKDAAEGHGISWASVKRARKEMPHIKVVSSDSSVKGKRDYAWVDTSASPTPHRFH